MSMSVNLLVGLFFYWYSLLVFYEYVWFVFSFVSENNLTPYVSLLKSLAREHRKAPVFISKAQSTKVYEGDSARLECLVSAIPPPQIYWKRNNEMVQFNTDRIR